MTAVERLIEGFVPEHYDLFLDIERQTKTFSGEVKIKGQILKETFALHQYELSVDKVVVAGQAVPFSLVSDKEIVLIEGGRLGEVTLELRFSGHITDNMDGIYPSYYTVNGLKKEVISTQFESHFARKAFPCVDEPEAKATFDLAIRFDQEEGELVLSNMPEIHVEERKTTGIWRFDRTPRMSSYLLAFAIGDLHGKTVKTKNGTEVGVFGTKAHPLTSMDFALDIAVRVIEHYEDYFGVKYPIPLSYHVGLPDFSAGAMENWGLITYREIYLLADQNTTLKSRQMIALVIAHEVAHQWFGNLVTMKWWDDLWLNESFANMMEYLAIDAIEPSWNILEDFQTSGVPASLYRDATDGVQSVHVHVHHPDEINTLFDAAIVYAKGSRLMHMLHRWLGDDAFRDGLRTYFERHQYGNTVGFDLWQALSQASGKDVAGFMDSWLEQPGYPLVRARVEDDTLILSQSQFFIGEHEDKKRVWHIPLNSNWTGLPDTLDTKELRIPGYGELAKANSGALRLNDGNTAHYLTSYEGELLDAILADLQALDPISKRQILQERQLLAEGGQIAYADLIPMIEPLADETSYLVTSMTSQLLGGLSIFVEEDTEMYQAFMALRRKAFVPSYERLGWEEGAADSEETTILRPMVLNGVITSHYPPAQEQASAIFRKYQDHLEAIPAHMRTAVLLNEMITNPSDDLVKTFFKAYVKTVDTRFRYDLVAAITRTKSKASLTYILEQLQNKEVIKPQDLKAWYQSLLSRPFSQDRVWEWACDEWEWITKTLGGDMAFEGFVTIPAGLFQTQEKLDSYKAFFEPQLDDMAISRSIGMGIKEIAARVDLIEKEADAVHQALRPYLEA
ncbi:aminopeptidase N [Streptococcus rupicaprae]|uniref:Aminopeptidase n=1 Tax=Streptococcus rupicaprae TaxID=759619 RepID=A0ABV2FII1_9STRE